MQISMQRTLSPTVLMVIFLGLACSDEESATDCRRATGECASQFACVEGADGRWDCEPVMGAAGSGGEAGSGGSAGTGGVGAAAGVGAAGGGGAPPGRAAGKRARGTEHSYTSLSALPLHRQQGGKPHYDLFGVVVEYRLPQATRGTDMRCSITVVDETCTSAADAHVATFFKAQPVPPGVGSVVRFHRIRPSGVYDGIRQLEATAQRGLCLTSWVYNRSPPAARRQVHVDGGRRGAGRRARRVRALGLAQSDGLVAARVSPALTEAAPLSRRLPPGTVSGHGSVRSSPSAPIAAARRRAVAHFAPSASAAAADAALAPRT